MIGSRCVCGDFRLVMVEVDVERKVGGDCGWVCICGGV